MLVTLVGTMTSRPHIHVFIIISLEKIQMQYVCLDIAHD